MRIDISANKKDRYVHNDKYGIQKQHCSTANCCAIPDKIFVPTF